MKNVSEDFHEMFVRFWWASLSPDIFARDPLQGVPADVRQEGHLSGAGDDGGGGEWGGGGRGGGWVGLGGVGV